MAHSKDDRTEKTSPRPGQAAALLVAFIAVLAFFLSSSVAHNASLEVRVSPAGAKVELLHPAVASGEAAERSAGTGIVVFERLVGGEQAHVVVRAHGFKDGVGKVMLPGGGGRASMTIHLKEETGQLLVETDPPGSQVFIDNSPRGRAPAILAVAPGSYTVSARRRGFEPAAQEVTIAVNGSLKILLVMKKQEKKVGVDGGPEAEPEEEPLPPGWGRVVLKSSHPSTFIVDNQLQGTALTMRRNVRAGPHIIGCRAERKGQTIGMDTRRVEVIENETLVVEFEFEDDTIARAHMSTDPNQPLYWVVKGGSTRNSGKYGDSVDMFKRALELDPDYATAHRQLGYTLPALKKWDESIEHWERYLELNPHASDKKKIEGLIMQVQRIQDAEAKGEEWNMADILDDPGVGFRK